MGIKEILKSELKHARELRYLEINFKPELCQGVWQCYEVCPVGKWQPNYESRKVLLLDEPTCIACGACVLQCPQGAISLEI